MYALSKLLRLNRGHFVNFHSEFLVGADLYSCLLCVDVLMYRWNNQIYNTSSNKYMIMVPDLEK